MWLFLLPWIPYVMTSSAAWLPGLNRNIRDDQLCNNIPEYTTVQLGRPSGTPNIKIKLDQTSYLPGKPVQVTVHYPPSFVGLIAQAQDRSTSASLGRFIDPTRSSSQVVSLHTCSAANDTLVYWRTGDGVTELSFNWLAEGSEIQDNDRPLSFVLSLFPTATTILENQRSVMLSKGFEPVDVSGCGKTKGCFRYSESIEGCTHSTCTYLFTYRVEDYTIAIFELTTSADWAAIGFSSDNRMGGDTILLCRRDRFRVSVENYFSTRAYINPTLQTYNPTSHHQTSYEDGRVSCRFRRALKVDHTSMNLDLNIDWYQLYAWGHLSSGALARHDLESPPTSEEKIALIHYKDLRAGSRSINQSWNLVSLLTAAIMSMTFTL